MATTARAASRAATAQDRRAQRSNQMVAVFVALALLFSCGFCSCSNLFLHVPLGVSEASTGSELTFRVDREPGTVGGTASWTHWARVATPAQWDALWTVRGINRAQVQSWVTAESTGISFVREVSVGTILTNTGFNSSGWYRVGNYSVKEGDTTFLTDDKGEPAVKTSCGNPVGPPREWKPKRPDEPDEPEPTKSSENPLGDPQDTTSGNPTAGNPSPPAATPDYTENNAEDTEARRGSGAGTTGNAGTGTGTATTPSGSNSAGEVTAPSTEQPAETPATSETADGETGDVQ